MGLKRIILSVVLVGLLLPATLTTAGTLNFGIVPQQTPSQLLHAWGPVMEYLSRRTGHQFVFRTAPNIPTFEDRTAAGEYDFVYMNPYHFTVFNQGEQGYQAVARARDAWLQGILVVRRDSPIRQLTELQGSTLAFPAPAAFAASVLPRAHLSAEKIPFTPQYVASHESVYKSVAAGLFPAGGGIERTFMATDPGVREQLRILWTTPAYTPHAIAARAGLDSDLVRQVQEALISIEQDEVGRQSLTRLKIKGFETARNSDWDDVRSLRIDMPLGTFKDQNPERGQPTNMPSGRSD